MKLCEIVKELKAVKIIGKTDIEISEVQTQSNSVTKNSLFICLKGNLDGHDFVSQAENYGAVAIVCEKEVQTNLTQIIVDDTRKALSIIAYVFYGKVSDKMKFVGVTGTNGKTTVSSMIYSVLKNAGESCALIGTLGVFFKDKFIEPTLTTPDPLTLHKILKDMYVYGIRIVVMEVSAHASFYQKVFGLKFEVAVFTNLTQDHLDFFKDMENYKNGKLKFLRENECRFIVSNSDDETGREISSEFKNCITYGIDNPADVFAINIKAGDKNTTFIINLFDKIYKINLNLIGYFNVYNALASATALALLGLSTEQISEGLNLIEPVSGRLELIYSGEFSVFIDYAHTPDGLLKCLTSLKNVCKGKLISVFGCGGNRDAKKREIMGKISGENADFTVITTDNPRFEDPMEIISSIEKGMLKVSKNYVIIQDRTEGIKYAVNYAKEGDIVLIAGKGAEQYQDVLGIKHPYNDKDTVKEILGESF